MGNTEGVSIRVYRVDSEVHRIDPVILRELTQSNEETRNKKDMIPDKYIEKLKLDKDRSYYAA